MAHQDELSGMLNNLFGRKIRLGYYLLVACLLIFPITYSRLRGFEAFQYAANDGQLHYIRHLATKYQPLESSSPLSKWSYYIALNLFNNEDILPQLEEQIVIFATLVGEEQVFVSIFENGSRDKTPQILAAMRKRFVRLGIKHHIESTTDDWRRFCPEIVNAAHRRSCINAACVTLRDCPVYIRIPVMAAIRNMALLPLLNTSSMADIAVDLEERRNRAVSLASLVQQTQNDDMEVLKKVSHLGLTRPVQVLFLNDVVLYAEDMLRLVSTNGGNYDMACAMDFELLKFYDTWVGRDLLGQRFHSWFPYLDDAQAVDAIVGERPVRVLSCWNGAVVIPAARIVHDGIIFRSWVEGEKRSLNKMASPNEVYDLATCPASECQLICKDMWEVGRPRIFMNPAVKLVYNFHTEQLQRILMRTVNSIFVRPLHALLHPPEPSLGKRAAAEDVGLNYIPDDENIGETYPVHVECGFTGKDEWI